MRLVSKRPLKQYWREAARLLLPQDCAVCAAPTDGGLICAACAPLLTNLAPHCPRCALPSPAGRLCGACIWQPPHFDRTVAATSYAFPLDRLMLDYKYHATLAYAALFADMLCSAVGSAGEVDLLIPMPLHYDKLRARGFNQAHELARRIAPRLGVRVDAFAATRIKPTTVQADLPVEARAKNVRNAFSASAAVMGRHVAIVDDVMTTGATLDELARTLKAHGAIRVENWIVARALLNP
jgi:ComF family protein